LTSRQQLTDRAGEILNLGADWGLTDPQTGIFSADTRYNLRTHDGANILLQTSGPAQPEGGLQLRVLFETGDKDYYWLNNVVAVGLLSNVEGGGEDSFLLRIDVWHVSDHFLGFGLDGLNLMVYHCTVLTVSQSAVDNGERSDEVRKWVDGGALMQYLILVLSKK
jgi:hypothetical protein